MSHAQSDSRTGTATDPSTDIDVQEVRDADAPLLEIRNVTKTFGSVISLSDISTTVRAGQVTCVLGDNGAGKSTFIKMLSGVHQPDQGELLMDGSPVTSTSRATRWTPASPPCSRTSPWCR